MFAGALWFFDRKKSSRNEKVKGFGMAIFYATASFLRDLVYTPKTLQARIVIIVWLIISTVSLTLLTSITTSVLTYSLTQSTNDIKIRTDLKRRKIATLSDAANMDYVLDLGVSKKNIVAINSDTEGLKAILDNKVSVVMGGYDSLEYIIKRDPNFIGGRQLKMGTYVAKLSEIGFAIPQGSTLREIITRTIKDLQNEGILKKICKEYMDENKLTGCLL